MLAPALWLVSKSRLVLHHMPDSCLPLTSSCAAACHYLRSVFKLSRPCSHLFRFDERGHDPLRPWRVCTSAIDPSSAASPCLTFSFVPFMILLALCLPVSHFMLVRLVFPIVRSVWLSSCLMFHFVSFVPGCVLCLAPHPSNSLMDYQSFEEITSIPWSILRVHAYLKIIFRSFSFMT
jgi:hypothetical protein